MIAYNCPAEQVPQGRLDPVYNVALVMLDSRDKTPYALEQIGRLARAGWTVYGSAGTAKFLNENGIFALDIKTLTGHDPAMTHRMASCSWETNSCLISNQNNIEHLEYLLGQLCISPFQLLICTVYGLDEEMRNPDSSWKSRLEKTDFGGPAALRAAAKGRRAIVFRLDQLEDTINRLLAGSVTSEWLEQRAAETEHFCAWYSGMSAANISNGNLQTICLEKVRGLRRGENPYQTGAMLMHNITGHDDPLALDKFQIVGDTEPGWINLTDANSALNCLTTLAAVLDINGYLKGYPYFGVIVKHGNPVGLAIGRTPKEVLRLVFTGNPRAAFGGVAMFNFIIDDEWAKHILHSWLPEGEKYRYLVGIVAPEFTPEAVDLLRGKEVKKQLLINPALRSLNRNSVDTTPKYRPVRGGTLVSNGERYLLDLKDKRLEEWHYNHRMLNESTLIDLLIAFTACACSYSNTTSCANNNQLVGNGVGQQDRIGSCELAMVQAGERAIESVVVTDSFFPKPDGLQVLIDHGATLVMSTTGSKSDQEVRDLAAERGVALVQIPDTDGRMFSGH